MIRILRSISSNFIITNQCILVTHPSRRKTEYCFVQRTMATWETEKEKYIKMDFQEKRKFYKVKKHVELKEIPSWKDYFLQNKQRLEQLCEESTIKEKPDPIQLPDKKLSEIVTLWRGDITQLEIDAIVNAANTSLLGGGGVDGAIHRAAGPRLKEECASLNGCNTGEAKITGGYLLPAKYVIHTVGPRGEKPDLLTQCYNNSLEVLTKNDLHTIAFPCISTGVYGYPQEKAAHIALSTVRSFLRHHHSQVHKVIFTLFLEQDVEIYETLMQSYFPIEE